MIRVATDGSIFEIDEALNRYRRMPRDERPRERPEWSDERAGALQDFVWHDMPEGWQWYICDVSGRLVIRIPEGKLWRNISAPGAEVLSR